MGKTKSDETTQVILTVQAKSDTTAKNKSEKKDGIAKQTKTKKTTHQKTCELLAKMKEDKNIPEEYRKKIGKLVVELMVEPTVTKSK